MSDQEQQNKKSQIVDSENVPSESSINAELKDSDTSKEEKKRQQMRLERNQEKSTVDHLREDLKEPKEDTGIDLELSVEQQSAVKKSALPGEAAKSALPGEVEMHAFLGKAEKSALPKEAEMRALLEETEKSALPEEAGKSALPEEAKQSALSEETEILEEAEMSALLEETEMSAFPEKVAQSAFPDEVKQSTLVEETEMSALVEEAEISAFLEETRKSAFLEEAEMNMLPEESGKCLLPQEVKQNVFMKEGVLSEEAEMSTLLEEAEMSVLPEKNMLPAGAEMNVLREAARQSALPEGMEHAVVENLWTRVGAAVIILIAIGVALCANQFCGTQTSESRSALQIFQDEFKRLQKDFPEQNHNFWLRSGKMLTNHLNKSHPDEPATIILTAAQDAKSTLLCLGSGLAQTYAAALNSNWLLIHGPSQAQYDSSTAKLHIDEQLSSGFETEHRAAVLDRLETLPPGSLLILYKYCDHENAAYKNVALVFTVLLEDSSLEPDTPLPELEEKVRDFLWQQFIRSGTIRSHQEMDSDKLSGVWSRISHLVLPVLPVKGIEAGNCPFDHE